ncbi:serine/threonine-protein kinase Nek4 isoform 4-T4 [Dugong dugon]
MPLAAYCYLRAVGRGSYGEVTLVRHRRDGRQYVIKKLNLRNASSRERRAAEQEAQLLSQLKHPNIVTYKESWEGGDGLLYIVMGFCEGGDLYRKLKEQKGRLLPESQVVEWFVQIAMALQYLHEKHILHRDLKTQNVFLTRTNIIKVGDLGIARVLENHCDMASTLIGTPYYMSPELFSNKPYNYKSDVWALGCCVYEMATLKHAFNAKDMNSLVYRIIEGKLPPVPKDYSPALAELIRTMLSKRPEERPSVRSILRQPYIKHHISLFLEATKAKTCKNNVKNGDFKPVATVISGKAQSNKEVISSQPYSSEGSKTYIVDPVAGECIVEKQDRIHPGLQPHSSGSEPSLSRQRRQKRREQTEHSGGMRQFQEVSPRQLPSLPAVGNTDVMSTQKDAEHQSRDVGASVSSSRGSEGSSSKDRPLSARERRRLKQSQEEMFPSGPSVRRASLSAVGPGKPQEEGQPIPAKRFSSDCSIAQEKKLTHCLSEEELSSSTSSADKSDGDSREGKGHTNEMSDLVKLMTQTLKLDSKESYEELPVPNPVSEFKLHRKYRDTLILHGKIAEEAEELHFKELPSAIVPGSEKIRRIVEVLRADVIQGLGIQLLEQVYDLLEEEDELEREVRLREHLGEKYTAYSLKARQLKFFEENVNF